MNIREQVTVLIYKHITGQISSEEKATLEEWLAELEENRLFFHEVENSNDILNELLERQRIVTADDQERAWRKMTDAGAVPGIAKIVKPRWTWWRYSVAIVVFLCVVLVTFIVFFNSKSSPAEQQPLTDVQPAQISPGTSKATLTLSDGRKISLDSASSKLLAIQGDVQIQNKDGQLAYLPGKNNNGQIIYNSLSTAKGQVYATTLSDGTKIWLNSASSLRYPVAFYGKDRTVEINGEAYFEVAHNKQMPFKVLVKGSQVEVTGTSFNIKSYDDEAIIRTTLLEGGVRIYPSSSGSNMFKVIKPGQQAQIAGDKSVKIVSDVDVEEAMAWKNGMFVFNSSSIKDIIKQLELWYDVDARYLINVDGLTFTGKISRYDDIEKILEKLELLNKFHFKLEGKTIVVSK